MVDDEGNIVSVEDSISDTLLLPRLEPCSSSRLYFFASNDCNNNETSAERGVIP